MKTISYAIPVCNEHREIRTLLTQLLSAIRKEDEVVVQLDSEHVTQEVRDVVEEFKEKYAHYEIPFKTVEFPLAMDFARFKNNLNSECSCDYIFQIDADEYLGKYLLRFLPNLLASNPDPEAFIITRVNGVRGLTEEYVRERNWWTSRMEIESLKDCDYTALNFPDKKVRIMKNIPTIKWVNSVHEHVAGFLNYVDFTTISDLNNHKLIEAWSLIHIKDFERQKRQNEFYDEF